MEGSQRDTGAGLDPEGAPGTEEPVAQADRLFVNLTEQAARPRPRERPRERPEPSPEPARDEVAPPEVPPQTGSGARLADLEEVLETVSVTVTAINERLASLERILVTDEPRSAEAPGRAAEQPEPAPQPSAGPSVQPDDALTSEEDVEVASGGLPVLGLIPQVDRWKDRLTASVSMEAADERVAAEAYRALRTSVLFLGVDRHVRSIQVTSPLQGDGKSTTAAHLAVTLAEAGNRVIVMCCDLRRPRLHEFFGLSNEIGFTSVIHRRVTLQRVVQEVPGIDNLKLVASGPVPTNPSELLVTSRANEVIRVLQAQCDVLLIDCPPVLPVTDAVTMSQRVDGTIVVVRAGSTSRRDLHRSVERLRQVNAPLLGTVVNSIARDDGGFGLGYGDRYEYAGYARAEGPPTVGVPVVARDSIEAEGHGAGDDLFDRGSGARKPEDGGLGEGRRGRRIWARPSR